MPRRAFPNIFSAHVILKGGAAEPGILAPGVPVWLDVEGRLHEKLHANDRTLILVRPDGYIGYRCQPADGHALTTHMSRYLVCKR